ncbi:hypothetical protein [Elizabethkingia anophelis]|uniref:Uncharacterized protein n=2 Tax=Elizabethkingia anophelis TaxID=1117645 RepID=A0A077EN12_9FLAO|nr:hypothetical protein [Elizabethkingia anophelis]AIL46960.1 hypothetical protein BD94_3185 [Elizabethkingia anophelis NUHP1]
MNDFLKAIDEVTTRLEEKGYDYCRLSNGIYGSNLKECLLSYHDIAKRENELPKFPIYAIFIIAATSPDNPYSLASFKIEQGDSQTLQITNAKISMYECYDGGVRASIDLQFKTIDDIPTRQNAANQIEERWRKLYKENQEKWHTPKDKMRMPMKDKKPQNLT